MRKDYYKILGLNSDASSREIKQAFRRKVKEHHPDVNPDASDEAIHDIYEAYDILGDPAKRSRYDQMGDANDLLQNLNVWKARQEAKRRYHQKKYEERMAYVKRKMKEKQVVDRKIKRFSFMFLGFIIVLIASIVGWNRYDSYRKTVELETHGNITTGSIYEFTSGWISASDAFYTYEVDGQVYSGRSSLAVTIAKMPLSNTGMPAYIGDEFKVMYSSRDPSISRLLLDEPTNAQINRYLSHTTTKCAHQLDVETNKMDIRREYCACVITGVYKEKGLAGIADIYFNDVGYLDNIRHNRYTYETLTNEPFFRMLDATCSNKLKDAQTAD